MISQHPHIIEMCGFVLHSTAISFKFHTIGNKSYKMYYLHRKILWNRHMHAVYYLFPGRVMRWSVDLISAWSAFIGVQRISSFLLHCTEGILSCPHRVMFSQSCITYKLLYCIHCLLVIRCSDTTLLFIQFFSWFYLRALHSYMKPLCCKIITQYFLC